MPQPGATASPPLESVDKSEDRVRGMFAAIAGRYDLLNHLLSLNVDRWWRRRTVKLAPPQGEAPILDICTGTGDLALAYYRAGQGKLEVIGSDFCPEMLELAEVKKNKARIDDRLTFVEADAQELPFQSDRFQIVSVAFGLRNVTNTDRGLAEMTRVCAPGGRVVILEFTMPRWQPFKALYSFYFHRVLPRIGQCLARNQAAAYNYLPASVEQFPQGEALAERMRAAGLTDITFHPLTFGIATLYLGHKPAASG